MRTMIALVFAATIGFTLTTAAAAGAPGHVPKPTKVSSGAALSAAGHAQGGAHGHKWGSPAASKPVEHSARPK
jgi:hypothetical protein